MASPSTTIGAAPPVSVVSVVSSGSLVPVVVGSLVPVVVPVVVGESPVLVEGTCPEVLVLVSAVGALHFQRHHVAVAGHTNHGATLYNL